MKQGANRTVQNDADAWDLSNIHLKKNKYYSNS